MPPAYPPYSSLPSTPNGSPPTSSASTLSPALHSLPPRRFSRESQDFDKEDEAFLARVSSLGHKTSTARALWQKVASHTPLRHLALAVVALTGLYTVFASSRPTGPTFLPSPATYFDARIPFFDFNATDESEALPTAIAKSLRLTHEQCDVAFPKLWPQIERRRDDQKREGGVSERHLDAGGGGARVALIDGDLFVKKFEPFGTRTQSVLGSLHEAVAASAEPLPDVDFYFQPLDKGYPGPVWETVQPRPGAVGWLVPDFGFFSWPEPILTGYKGVLREIERVEKEVRWSRKLPKIFWRGAFLAPIRDALRDAAEGQPWGDIGSIEWRENGKGSVPLWDHCRYKYLAHAEGYEGAYSGRLKYLLNCKSVVISHPLHWDQHFHAAFDSDPNSPNQNIVMLGGNDWEELPETMEFLEGNPERAKLIAENARRTLAGRYLTPASTACYWRRMLVEYAKTQKFKPQIGDGKDYESFMLMGRMWWEPS
ncbi:hypothetical protein P7C70_g3546, partial [Phenoliferia sp. Uapishka_3]